MYNPQVMLTLSETVNLVCIFLGEEIFEDAYQTSQNWGPFTSITKEGTEKSSDDAETDSEEIAESPSKYDKWTMVK